MTASKFVSLIFLLTAVLLLTGCERPDPEIAVITRAAVAELPPTPLITPFVEGADRPPAVIPPTATTYTTPLPTYNGTPTPDPPHTAVNAENLPFANHVVAAGETLGYLAQLYGSSIEELQETNGLGDTDLLYVGQSLVIPTQTDVVGSSFKIIPDSELVYGPAAADFVIRPFLQPYGGYLLRHEEVVEGQSLAGPEVVGLVAHRFSINPRLLLALLEYRSGWVTQPNPAVDDYPLGYRQPRYEGLYQQLSWAADKLNWGFYGRSEAGITSFLISDGTRLAFAPDINHGTAGVQVALASHDAATYAGWLVESGPDGFFAAYQRLFGNPFAYTVDPLWPADLQQPPLRLPWSADEAWYFTGGPHGGWASGSAWAALDFVPEGEPGCNQSEYWVTAMADGVVIRSDFGAVVVDMDGDGYAGTGWAILYMHLETRDRIPAGTVVQAGDRLGHPSCEGGFSNGTHVHIARTYNGRWVAADGALPFAMAGWVSQGLGREYDGLLVRGGVTKEACECRAEINRIGDE